MSARDSLRATAYIHLGVESAAVARAPQITPQLRAIRNVLRANPPQGPGGDIIVSWPHYLAMSDAPEAQQVLTAYNSISRTMARLLPVEAFCVASGVSPLRVLELLTAVIVRSGAQASTIIAAVNHPRIVEKTVEMALTDEGVEDRSVLHKAVGFLPTPKSAQTNISVVTNASANAASVAQAASAPPPEQTIRKLVDRFNDARKLPAPADTMTIPTADERAVPETIEISLNENDDEGDGEDESEIDESEPESEQEE